MASNRIKGITIEVGGDTSKLTSALKEVDGQLKTTQSNLKDINKLLELDPGNVELLRQKQNALNDSVSMTKDRLDELKAAQEQVGQGTAEWDALQREIIETEQNLENAEQQLKDFGSVTKQQLKVVGDKFKEVGGKISDVGKKLSVISGAAAGALGGIAKAGLDSVKAADELNTLSKQTGVSTDELQKWSYAAELVDVDVNTITGAMKKMKKGLDSNADAFEALGVKTRDDSGNLRDATDIFYDTIAALSQIDNETERDVAAMDIFGKSADDLAGIIDDGGAALKSYGEEAEQMGLILSEDTLTKLNDVNDTVDKTKATMQASFAEAAATIVEKFAPAMDDVVYVIDRVAEGLRNLSPEQAEMIVKVLGVIAVLGPVVTIIGNLITAIGTVISVIGAAGPVIAAIGAVLMGPVGIILAIIAAVGALAVAIYLNFDKIKAFAADVARGWNKLKADTIAAWNNMKQNTATAWENMKSNISTKVANAKNAASTAFNTMKSNASSAFATMKSSVASNAGSIFQTIKTKIGGAVDFIKDLPKNAWNWGHDLIQNFVDGIKGAAQKAGDAAGWVAEKIADYIHFSVPDKGPLADADKFMPDMIQLLSNGIEKSLPMLDKAADDMASVIASDATPSIQNGQAAASKTVNAPISINVYGAQGQDVNQLADIIQAKMNRAVVNQKAVFA